MAKQLVHWFAYILGITLIAAPAAEGHSVWADAFLALLGGMLLAYGLESIIKDIIREEYNGR